MRQPFQIAMAPCSLALFAYHASNGMQTGTSDAAYFALLYDWFAIAKTRLASLGIDHLDAPSATVGSDRIDYPPIRGTQRINIRAR